MPTSSVSVTTPSANSAAATGYMQADGFVSPTTLGTPVGTDGQHSKGPARFPSGIASGTLIGAAGVQGKMSASISKAMTVTATANTDFTVAIPVGATITALQVYTTTAFLAATDAKVEIGASAGDNAYVDQTSIKAGGVVTLSPVATVGAAAALLSAPSASPNLFVRIVQTGTASATGAATLVVSYTGP